MEYKRLLKDGTNLFLGSFGTTVIGLINLIILTRILSIEEMGKYSLFLMISSLALTMGLSWSDASIIRHGREEFIKHKKINKSFWARMYLFIPITLLFCFLFILFSKQISDYIGIGTIAIVFLLSVFLLNGIVNLMINIYQSVDQIRKSAYIYLLQKAVLLGLFLILLFSPKAPNADLILLLLTTSFLVTIIIQLFFFDFNLIKPFKYDKEYFRKIWSFSWPQLIGFSGIYTINYIDLFVIRKYMTLSDVGIYTVAYNGFTVITGVIMLINTIMMPLLVEYRTKKKFELIEKYMKKIPYITIIWIILAITGMFIADSVFLFLFSEKYLASLLSFKILLIGTIPFFISTCLTPLINSFDLVLKMQIINIIMAVVNVILDFVLVPKIGIIGAAYATIIAFTVSLLLKLAIVWYYRRVFVGEEK